MSHESNEGRGGEQTQFNWTNLDNVVPIFPGESRNENLDENESTGHSGRANNAREAAMGDVSRDELNALFQTEDARRTAAEERQERRLSEAVGRIERHAQDATIAATRAEAASEKGELNTRNTTDAVAAIRSNLSTLTWAISLVIAILIGVLSVIFALLNQNINLRFDLLEDEISGASATESRGAPQQDRVPAPNP